MFTNSFELYSFLDAQNLLQDSPPYWWPNAGTFEIVITSVLTQNTTWSNVEKSLKNLEYLLDLDTFLSIDEEALKSKIKPSGFYNQKAPRLLELAKDIKVTFSNFENFQNCVTRNWLLSHKGIGPESADAILCYGCFRDVMVVDSYTKRVLKQFNISFSSYDSFQIFLEEDIRQKFPKEELNLVFAKFHGMFVEYAKISL